MNKSKSLVIVATIVGVLFLAVGLFFYNKSTKPPQEAVTQESTSNGQQQEQQDNQQQVTQQQAVQQPVQQQVVQQETPNTNQNEQTAQPEEGVPQNQQVSQPQQVAQNQQIVTNQEQQPVTNQQGGSPASNIGSKESTSQPVSNEQGGTNQQLTPPTQTSTNQQSTQQIVSVDKNALGAVTATNTKTMNITGKRVYKTSALDADLVLSQTAYVIIVSDGTLTLPVFLTASTYNTLKEGDTLKVTYSTFNDNGNTLYDVYKVEK